MVFIVDGWVYVWDSVFECVEVWLFVDGDGLGGCVVDVSCGATFFVIVIDIGDVYMWELIEFEVVDMVLKNVFLLVLLKFFVSFGEFVVK